MGNGISNTAEDLINAAIGGTPQDVGMEDLFSFEAGVSKPMSVSTDAQFASITHVTANVGQAKHQPDGTLRPGTPYLRLRFEDTDGDYAFGMVMANRDDKGKLADYRWPILYEAMGFNPELPVQWKPVKRENSDTLSVVFSQGTKTDVSLVGVPVGIVVESGNEGYEDRTQVNRILSANRVAAASGLDA